ncbi:MAG: nucleotidyltransferase domain-containing protein [Bacteroidetes bacterium]|nr:nucleotidyltransferase domain-containing protein [Bacteroidota bacterium]
MRLKQDQVDFFKNAFRRISPEAKIYLFGSRADDNARGGDIDILVLTSKKISLSDKQHVYFEFCKQFGEQKVDIVNFTFKEDPPFKAIAMSTAIGL